MHQCCLSGRIKKYWLFIAVLMCTRLHGEQVTAPFTLTSNEFVSIGDVKKIPENVVTSLAQDNQGYLWIGTAAGMVRYDGYRFILFTHDTDNTDSIPGNFIRNIMPLPDGKIWVSTEPGGVSLFDPVTEIFNPLFSRQQLLNNPHLSGVSAIEQDRLGNIWLGTKNGLVRIDATDYSNVQSYTQESHELLHNDILALMLDKSGVLWVGSRGGLHKYDAAQDSFENIKIDPQQGLDKLFVRSLYQDGSGRVWVGTDNNGVYFHHSDNNRLHKALQGILAENNISPVYSIEQANQDEIWVGRFDGIDIMNSRTGQWLHRIVSDSSDPNSLTNNDIRAMLKDKSGIMWVAGYGGGVQRHQQNDNGLSVLRYSMLKPNLLSDPNVSSILETQSGQIWIGTRGAGIDVFNANKGVTKRHQVNLGAEGSLQSGWITALTQDQQGHIWVGANPSSLYRFDEKKQTFQSFSDVEGLNGANIRVLRSFNNGDLLIGTNSGLAIFSVLEDKIYMLPLQDGSAFRDGVNAIAEDIHGNFWIATAVTGLYKLQKNTQYLQQISGTTNDNIDIRSANIVGMLIDSQQRFWLDTSDGLFTVKNWVSENEVKLLNISRTLGYARKPFGANLLEDSEGRIWTQNFILYPDEMKVVELHHADGNNIGTPWFRSYTKTRSGNLLFGGSKGLLMIEPTKFSQWQFNPPLVVTDLRIGGVPKNKTRLINGLTLEVDEQSFSIEFAALDFSEPESNQYAYKLQEFDKGWIQTDASRRSASYSNLWPDSYVLKIRGTNRNNLMSDEELSINVKVKAKIWQSPWFILSIIVLIGYVIYLAIGLRTRLISQRAAELKSLVDERTKELQRTQNSLIEQEKMASLGSLVAGISHEINTPIGIAVTAASSIGDTATGLQVQIADNKLTRSSLDKYVAYLIESTSILVGSLERARQLISSFKQVAVDQSSEKRRKIDLDTFFQDIKQSLKPQLKKQKVTLNIQCKQTIVLDTYPGALFQVFSNFVNNSLIHGFPENAPGKIDITIEPCKESIKIDYRDDGVGMTPEVKKKAFDPFFTTRMGKGGSGLGLHLVYNFVTQLLGGTIELFDAHHAGFKCRVTLPLKAPQNANTKLYNYK